MDIFLLFYVLGLMVLFFLLGAAIGGAARGMKAHFFGLGESEVICGESEAARDRALADKSSIASAALGGAVGGAVLAAGEERQRSDVMITNDGVMVDANSDWQPQQAEPHVVIAPDAEIERGPDDEASVQEDMAAAQPLTDDEMPAGDDIAGAEIFRGVDAPEMEDAPAAEVAADFPEAEAHYSLEDESTEITQNDNPVDAEELVESLPEEVTVASSVVSSFEEAQHEALAAAGEADVDETEAGTDDEAVAEVGDGTLEAGLAAAGVAGATVIAAAAELAPDDEARMARPEDAKPVIWGYTNEDNNFNDIEFIADGDDDLKMIRGIDGEMEAALQALGVRQYEQIANLKAREVDFLRSRLGLTSEINQMGWVEQAKILSAGGVTAFAASLMPAVAVVEETKEEAVMEADEAPIVRDETEAADGAVLTEEQPANEEPVIEEVTTPVEEPVMDDEAFDEGEIAETEMVTDQTDEISEEAPAPEEHSDDGRLIGREMRERREEEMRNRYGSERRVVPPVKSHGDTTTGDEDAASPVGDETNLGEAAVSHIEGVVNEAETALDAETPIEADTETVVEPETIVEEVAVSEVAAPVDSDDLKQIKHISTGLEKKLNLLGVYKLSQIAAWTDSDIGDISEQLELKDRIREEGWIVQASEAMESGEAAQGGGFFGSALVARLAELDQLDDLTEHEKTLFSKHGVTSLSQIANWSGADQKWATELLQLEDGNRISKIVEKAKGLLSSGQAAVPGGMALTNDDDLKRIRGIDEETEAKLKEIGVSSYAQIAAFEQSDIDRINSVLGISGRVERQYWVVQAKVLRDGGTTDYSKLYDGAKTQD
jgi:predicted flap endonuclease-1-like 5' DNA nuclease